MGKETSDRVATLAAKILDAEPLPLDYQQCTPQAWNVLLADAKTLAGSALAQTETPGQEPRARYLIQPTPKISITDDGPNTVINVDYGNHVFHAHFSTGDTRACDAAISTVIEKICRFSRHDIYVKLYNYSAEQLKKPPVASEPVIGEPVQIGDADEDRNGPIPFGG